LEGNVVNPLEENGRKDHWESIYGTKSENEVSWFQASPSVSLNLIARKGTGTDSKIIDIGGGASRLVDALFERGFTQVTVLDIAEAALDQARRRLGTHATSVTWICADITRWKPDALYDVWHDRAVFHFLTEAQERAAYKEALRAGLRPGGTAIIATFALDGPERCSGLPIVRYSPETLAMELGPAFRLLDSTSENHLTPFATVQKFQFSRFRRL
jgi:ubiquinone/menaquinone biosynthesis C-methylase UbiE